MGILRTLLRAFNSHRAWGWLILLAYAAAVTFPHAPVQKVVGDWAAIHTLKRLYQVSVDLALAEAAIAVALFIVAAKAMRGGSERRWVIAFWLLSFGLMVGAWKLFMANNTELVHYPQYFPEGMALAALTLSPAEAVAWVVFFGGLDEAFQYTWVVGGRALPFDFNDVYMDLAGGAAGVVLAMAILGCRRRSRGERSLAAILKRPGIALILSIVAAGVVLWASGKMVLYESLGNPGHWFALSRLKTTTFWYFSPIILGPHHFHEMAPIEGPVVLLATLAIYAILDKAIAIEIGKPGRQDTQLTRSVSLGVR